MHMHAIMHIAIAKCHCACIHYYILTIYILTCIEQQHILYTCCRDGKGRINSAERKTHKTRKCLKGSRKLPSFCLSRMYVKCFLPSGKVEVLYVCTHTNHPLGLAECKYIPLSLSVKKEIQEKFSQGITLERIMNGN